MLAFLLLGTPLALLLLPVPRLPPLYSLITAITQPGLALTSCLPASTFQVLGLWTHATMSSPSRFHPYHWLRLPRFPLVTSHHPSPATSPGQSRETDMSTCAFSVKVSADPSPSFQSLWVIVRIHRTSPYWMCLLCSWMPCVREDRILFTDFRDIFSFE